MISAILSSDPQVLVAAVARGGGYGARGQIGGWLQTGRIDRSGVTIHDACDLDRLDALAAA